MAFKHTLKRGSTRPVLRYPLPGVDLTGASVTFLMSPRPGQPATVNGPAVIANGALEYHWQHGDTDKAVMHYGEFEVVFPGGAIETFPADDYIRVEIKQDIGDGGTVAPPAPITLTGALVEAGADVASGAGALAIALSGSLVEAGSDTAAGTGTVTTPTPGSISLSAALIEAGADTAAVTGTVGITVSAAMVETGADTAAGTGTVTDPAPQAATLSYFTATHNTHPWYAAATGPSAAYDAASNATYICWQSHDPVAKTRRTDMAVYNHATKTWGKPFVVGVGNIQNDDHGVPALCITSDGYIVVFWGTHNSTMLYAVSKSPRTVADGWNSYSLTGVEYTYWRPIPRSDGGIDLFCRSRVTAEDKMPLVYRLISMAAGVPTMGAEATIVDFGSNSRGYSGDTFRGDDGRLWMVATRADWLDVTRKNVYLFRIDPATGTVTSLAGASKSMPLSRSDADDYILYTHDSSSSVTGNIPSMGRDAAGRLHISFNVGLAAGTGGTEDLSPQEVYHLIVDGSTVGAPFKIADLDQRYEAARCIPLAAGAMGIYYPSTEGLRGGSILRRVIPAGAVAAGAVETILARDPARYGIDGAQLVQNAHPDFRTAFGEIGPDDQDASARGHRLWAHGDSGFVTRPAPVIEDVPLPSGSLIALDMTKATSFAVNADGSGGAPADLGQFRRILDGSGNANDLELYGSVPGIWMNTDTIDRKAALGKTGSAVIYRRPAVPLVTGGEFSLTALVAPTKSTGDEGILIGFDQGSSQLRSFNLAWMMVQQTVRLTVFNAARSGLTVTAAPGIMPRAEFAVVSIIGTPTDCSVRLNGSVVLTVARAVLPDPNTLSLGGNAIPASSQLCDAMWRRLIARTGAVSQAQIAADEAWVQRLANLT